MPSRENVKHHTYGSSLETYRIFCKLYYLIFNHLFQIPVNEVCTEKNGILYIDINPLVAGFDEFLMKHLLNVVSMNISNCIKVDPEMFINAVVKSKQITHLTMNSCKQFSEYQLVQLLKALPNLIVVEALNTTPIFCVSAKEVLDK